VRLLVSRGEEEPIHTRFERLPDYLEPGDLLVVNTSATVAASLDATKPDGSPLVVHLSTALPSGLWLVELREPSALGASSHPDDETGTILQLPGGGTVEVLARFRGSRRLWLAVLGTGDVPLEEYLGRRGHPIRYRHVTREWPLADYQTVFARQPGSAEMPSAARPLSAELVVELVTRGIAIAPLVLHAGVSSLEGHEQPFPERYEVPPVTAALVNGTRRLGGRVIAVGTTVVRALETAAGPDGVVRPGSGWTDLVVTPERGVRATDGLLTGWHEPESSHLLMLEAIAGRPALEKAYRAALSGGYRWHEFGDSHLILPARRTP
ncbi:MAG: S-adenosylmethionine:tRNA ribosyltransferase-isomerase, partial [Acidimicrobiales bacterium]|nr:S-adenosylmethionine:tRNA ribosyltransferase-isomerase [Acidimicrobiales bacterium]